MEVKRTPEIRKRQPNFSGNEKLELFSIIHNKYWKIIGNKQTDKVSMSEKELAWKNIKNDFNASSKAGLYRDEDCLKRFYENRKREVRKLKARQRQEMMKTGGGPERKIIFDIADELLIQIFNIKTVEGLENSFDSDEHVIYVTRDVTSIDKFDTGYPPKHQTKKPKAKINKGKIVANRPRRSGIQILASSHIAKKYDELLDKRQILLDKQIEIANQDIVFQRARHKLELELLTLKVEREKADKK